eukprot:TRINITY_DN794_c2_g1_i1.p1 TRINITY_DN794_c2_g1~~TRINITY_DN794_c2_g1_i1.p1  ORF type:complete len:309 (+),score=63.37 TRINITY_DN794_c2_g1_i1:73-999(+)
MSANKIIDAFQSVTLDKLVSSQKLITVKHTNTIEQVVKILAENQIHAAPVLDGDSCIGFVDMLDVVTHVIKVAPEPEKIEVEELKSLQMAGRAMAFEEVQHVLNASGRDPYIPFQATSVASNAIDHFARGLHRVLLLDNEGKPLHTVSQSDFVNYLAQLSFEGKLKHVGYLQEKLHNIGFGAVVPTTVLQTDSVIKAITILNEKKLGAIAVVDENGKLVGNFSATDLRGLYTEAWPHFKWSVRDYLLKYSPGSIGNVVKLTKENTLADVLKIFKEKRIHQLYIVHSDDKPIGVVSLTDVMKFVRDTNK